MSGYIALAKEFRKRDNLKNIGPVVGRVMSELPDLKVSILNDQIILSAEQLYITDSLFKDTYNISLSGDMTINDVLQTISGDVSMKVDPLKKGEFIIVVPSGSGQEFFIVDRVRKVS